MVLARNQDSLDRTLEDPSVKFIRYSLNEFRHEIFNVLEIGCGGGSKLSSLSSFLVPKAME